MDLLRPTPSRTAVSDELGRAWREHRRHLLDIGFRILGDLNAAEDAVQEAFARLARADLDSIDDVGGWLVVVVSRVCLDRLRAERRHPTTPAHETLETPPDKPGADPADRVTLDDNVRLALQLVLERLTPPERTAFVLHDVFQYPFDAIAEVVGRSPAACRQLASRARRTIAAETHPARFRVETSEQRLVTERFLAACATGDLDGLLAVLDPHVTGGADVGGRVGLVVQTGRDAVAAAAIRFLGPDSRTTLLTLGGGDETGIIAVRDGQLVTFLTITVQRGLIHHIDGIADPTKLAPIANALGVQ